MLLILNTRDKEHALYPEPLLALEALQRLLSQLLHRLLHQQPHLRQHAISKMKTLTGAFNSRVVSATKVPSPRLCLS